MSSVELLKKPKSKSEDQDLILDVASELENLTKEEALGLAYDLSQANDQNEFRLGGVFSLIKTNGWFDGYKTFGDYVSEVYGTEYRKAMYCIEIYEKLVHAQIPWSKLQGIGWTKTSILAKILTAENVDAWVAKALDVNCKTLKLLVKGGDVTAKDEEVKITSDVTKVTLVFHPDQKAIFDQAVDKSKAEGNFDTTTVALEHICLGYLGEVVPLPAKGLPLKEQMVAVGFEKVLDFFQEIWPNITLTVDIPEELEA